MSCASAALWRLPRVLGAAAPGSSLSSLAALIPKLGAEGGRLAPPGAATGFRDSQGTHPPQPWATTGQNGASTALLPPSLCGGPSSGRDERLFDGATQQGEGTPGQAA